MAIIGNLYKLEKHLADKNLQIVFDYLKTALDVNSNIHNRIFNSPVNSFVKLPLTDKIFVLEQVFYTKNREECFIESHRKYIDFQLILEGVEEMEYIDIDKLSVDIPYDSSKDLIIYSMTDNTSKFVLEKADLAIFFPDDAHIGLPMYKEKNLVYKTVIKLPAELYK